MTLESPISIADRRSVSLAAFGADVARRRRLAGDPVIPRNAGNRRTESKKALLRAIEAVGGRW